MIRLVFASTGQLVPEEEDGQQKLVFRLPRASVDRGGELHQQLEELGERMLVDDAAGMVSIYYEGEVARKVQLVLELPDAVWDNLANCADDLLDEDFLPDEDEDLFDDEDWEDDDDDD
ncbi:MAG: hypothetical protein JW850_11615 [Thermoflexales bacterium]|nr:hypothetical protein [Thermoflexales bacterium]